jgi:uncharacterized membrane protein
MRGFLLAFASLSVWGGWFLLAYGLHGFQCAGPVDVPRQAGQWLQIVLWLGAIVMCGGLVWLSATRGVRSPAGLAVPAFWLNVIGLVSVIITGVAVLYVAPC